MKEKLFYFFVVVILSGCSQVKNTSDCIELKVDLNKSPNELQDVFSRMDVIPLETTDNSFVVYPMKVLEYANKFFIYDIHTQRVLTFSDKGKYLRDIGRKGQGPGEYTWLTSISINPKEETIQLLAPFGYYLNYTLDGCFIDKKILPDTKPNYQELFHLNDKIVTWTLPGSNEDKCISIINPQTMKVIAEYGSGLAALKLTHELYSYNGRVFHPITLENNNVYELIGDTMKLAYCWDFGDDNFKMRSLDLSYESEDAHVEYDKVLEYIENGKITFYSGNQQQNDKYYFSCLRYGSQDYDKSIFYHKESGEYFILGGRKDLPSIYPLIFNDVYVVCVLHSKDFEKWKKVLPASECKKLESMKEDDNPCLLKLYFK